MTIMHESPADSTTWQSAAERDRDAREQWAHAMTVLHELTCLLPPPHAAEIRDTPVSFHGHYGLVLQMNLMVSDLVAVKAILGGDLIVSAETYPSGAPYLRHELTGSRGGVPFVAWTTSDRASLAVAS